MQLCSFPHHSSKDCLMIPLILDEKLTRFHLGDVTPSTRADGDTIGGSFNHQVLLIGCLRRHKNFELSYFFKTCQTFLSGQNFFGRSTDFFSEIETRRKKSQESSRNVFSKLLSKQKKKLSRIRFF